MSRRAAKRDERGPLQKALDAERATTDGINPFAKQHGDYAENSRWGTREKITLNRGGTAIDRWRRDGAISDSQLAGILHCQNLWEKIGRQSVVANLDRTIRGTESDGSTQHDALIEIGRIASDFPATYWDVFEGVVRFDLPAGVAGSRLANVRRSAEIAARCIVCFIADLIATRERLSY